MKMTDFIGEATGYNKKEILEEREPRRWAANGSANADGGRTDRICRQSFRISATVP